ncbi:MAG: thiamine pyrophosphate-dependent enzyme [Nitrososphaerales archaeon]
MPENAVVVTGTFYHWAALKDREANFCPVNMGLCTAVALGLALALPNRKVIALDGDGNLLLNLSVLPDLAIQKPHNLIAIVFDNERLLSGGDMPSATAYGVDLEKIARGCGITNAVTVRTLQDFQMTIRQALAGDELAFIVAKVEPVWEALPKSVIRDGKEVKYRFIRHIEVSEGKMILTPLAKKIS